MPHLAKSASLRCYLLWYQLILSWNIDDQRILQFDWFCIILRPGFSQKGSFRRIINNIVPFLGLKKDTSNDRIFGKCQKTLFLRNLGVFPYFIEKFGFLRFWWLRASNLMWNLRKILSAVLEKNVLTDILTYWKWQPHALLAGGRDPKITHKWKGWAISPETCK